MNNWYLLAAIPVFGLLILVHEFGHFITAKWAGIRVEEFGLGFPPRLIGFRKRNTGDWEIISFGTRFTAPPVATDASYPPPTVGADLSCPPPIYRPPVGAEEETLAVAHSKQSPFASTSGGITNVGAPVSDHTIYSLNLLPLGGFVRMPGENGDINDESGNYDPKSFAAKPAWKRIIVLSAGVIMNILLAMLLFTIAFGLGEPTFPAQIDSVVPGSPADMAGLRPGDTIISVNNQPVHLFSDLQAIVGKAITADNNQHATVPLTLIIKHTGQTNLITTTINVREHPPQGQGPMAIQGKVVLISSPLWQAPLKGVSFTVTTTGQFIQGIGQIFAGTAPAQVIGPVGIVKLTGAVAQTVPDEGFWPILSLTALLSLNLAIINILPFPALDGGRIVLVLVEILRGGKRLKPEREGMINLVGFALLLTLMLVITFFDVKSLLP